ncbi:unnamed protein product [Victoria cruziana]
MHHAREKFFELQFLWPSLLPLRCGLFLPKDPLQQNCCGLLHLFSSSLLPILPRNPHSSEVCLEDAASFLSSGCQGM